MLIRAYSALTILAFACLFGACYHTSGSDSPVDILGSSVNLSVGADVVADGLDSTTLTVTLVDHQGAPLVGWTVTPSVSGSNNTLMPASGMTNAMGVFVSVLTSTTAEDKTIGVVVSGQGSASLSDHPVVTFIGDASNIDAALSTATANPETGVVADGIITSSVTVTVRDVNGNVVAGQTVEIASDGSNNTITQPVSVTDAMGQAVATLASIRAELKTITATINPLGAAVQLVQQPSIVFIGDVANVDVAASTAVANPSLNVLADGIATSTITVTLLDLNGNLIPNAAVQLTTSGSGNILVQPQVSDAFGMTTGTLASTVAEIKTLMVTVDPNSAASLLNDQPTVQFVVGGAAISDTLSTISAAPAAGIAADGVAQSTITVTVLDVNGNPLSGQSVTLAATGTGNTLTQPAGQTGANGQVTGTLASTDVEIKTVSAVVDPAGAAVALVNTTTVDFAAPVSAAQSTATANPTNGLSADGVAISTVTITLRDAGGTLLAGREVSIASSGSGNVITQPAGPTNASGVATATIASTVAELKTITVTADPATSSVALADQPTVTFDAVAVDSALSTVVATPAFGALADGTDAVTITVTVLDAASQPLVGRTVDLSASGTGNTLTPASGMTDANGVLTSLLTSTQAEAKVISATADPGGGAVLLNDTPSVDFVWPIADTWFVRTTGSDAASGMSAGNALQTLAAAALVAQPGQTVYVGGGSYAGLVDIGIGGTPGNTIQWIADSNGRFTGDAGEVIIDAVAADYALRLTNAPYVVIDGFTIIGAGNAAVGAIDVTGTSDSVLITRNRIYNNAIGVRVDSADSALIEDNVITNNSGAGVVLEAGADSAALTNNLVYNNGAQGLRANAVIGLLVNFNTLYLNAGDQLLAEAGAVLTATDNIVADGLAAGIVQTGVGSTITSDHNDSFGHLGAANWQGAVQGANDISVDPLFQDADGADNALGGGSAGDDRLHVDQGGPSQTLDVGSADASTFTFASGDTATDRTTRADDLLDGEAPDAALANMGYHYRPTIDPLAALDVDDGRLFYGQGASSRPRVRDWDDSASSWNAEQATAPAASRIQYAIHEQSPLADGEEYLLTLATDGTNSELELVTWDGANWRREWGTQVIDSAHADKRGFDLGFEQVSAHGLIVYSDNTETPVYRTRELGRWSDAISLPLNDGVGPNPDPNTGIVLWVELVEKSGSDEVTLIYADDNSDLVVMTWDGSQWVAASAEVVETNLKTNPISGLVHSRSFDGAYESLTGDFLLAWGREGAQTFVFSERAAGAATFTASTLVFVISGITHYCDLAAEPGTDRIAAGFYDMGDGTERLILATWDGAAWQDTAQLDAQILDVNDTGVSDFPGEVAWLGSTGEAVCVYPDNQAGTLDWAHWTSATGWVLGADVAIAGKGTGESAFLRRFPNSERLLTVLSDSNGDLYSLIYDGTAWTLTNGGAALETDLSTISAAPFTFAFER